MVSDHNHSSPPVHTLKMQEKKVHWCPPPHGVIKVNFDAAFKTETYQGASGVVARNEHGQLVAAKCRQYESIPDALTAEAYAYRDGALLIKDLGLTKVMLKTDCQELVALGNSRATNRCAVISLLKQIQELSVNALILLLLCKEGSKHGCALYS